MEKMKTFFKEFFEDFTTKKKIIVAAIAAAVVALIVGIVLIFTLGGDKNPAGTYSIKVATAGEKALAEVGVYVYSDETMENLVAVGYTDESGTFSFESDGAVGCIVSLREVPRGYKVEETYEIKGLETVISLETQLLSMDEMEGVTFELGDVFCDFEITAANGNTYKLSELLKEKKAVVLNFWYINCGPCREEFPYLQDAYEAYSEDVEVLAMNPVDGTNDTIAAYMSELGITFPMASCHPDWESYMGVNGYPTTVVIDRFGTIGFIHSGSVTDAETFEAMFAYFTIDDYKQTTVQTLEELLYVEGGNGTKLSPFEITTTEFTAEVKAGREVYYQVYKAFDMMLKIEDPNAYVLYNEKKYEAVDGVVNVTINCADTYTPAVFAIGNTSEEDKEFEVSLNFKEGSINNPYKFTIGEFDVHLDAGKDQGIYYTFTAEVGGTLTLECTQATSGVEYTYSLYNLTTYEIRNLEEDAVVDENGNKTVSVVVYEGETVQLQIATVPNESNEYPACDFSFKATLAEGVGLEDIGKVVYSVTVVDGSGNALVGVAVAISGGAETIELTTNEMGFASVKLDPGKYTATVSAPNGFKTDDTQYELTEEKPEVTVTLEKKTAEKKTYTVKVVDEKGKAISGALVAVGTEYGNTNSSGTISFTLEDDNYTAAVSANGYQSTSKAFGSETSITVTLKKATGAESGESYSVTVHDYKGDPLTGVAVQFWQSGAVKAVVEVNNNGVATAKLPSGTYTVSLAGDYNCDDSNVTLTSSKKSITIVGAKKATQFEEHYFDADTYIVGVGGTYVEIVPGVDNYFIFTPAAAGTYKVTTSTPDAVITKWNGTTSFLVGAETSGQSIDLNVKESNIGSSYIISAAGSKGCILIIERTGDPILDETDYPWTIYQGTHTPKKLAKPNGTLKKFNVKATTYNIVLGSDGYYHKDSATGPIVYMMLGKDADYISMYTMIKGEGHIGGTAFRKYFYDDNQRFVKKEDYTQCMTAYIDCIDDTYGVYPLTEDLRYMMMQGGDANGWYTYNGPNYLFDTVKVSPDQAWMFACCTFE